MIIKVPDSWNEVTVSQFQEINSIPLESKSRALEIISILINEDTEEIRKYDMQSLNRIVAALGWCDELPSDKDFEEVLTIDDTTYHMVKMSSFSVGEWIDLEQYFEDPINNLHNILGVFYRDNSLPYDTITSEKRASIFRDKVNVGQVYGTVVFFLQYRKKLYSDHSGIFSTSDTEDGDEPETEAEKNTLLAEAAKVKKWGWYAYIYCLAKGDVTRIEQVMQTNFVLTLTHRSFEIENKKLYEFYEYGRYNTGLTG